MAAVLGPRIVTGDYRLLASRAGAAEFHARLVPDPAAPELWLHDIDAPALVLGSAQPMTDIDVDACRRAGVDIVRRRSGGGAVLLIPGEVVWIDVIVPAGAPGWAYDVHAPMVWLGRHLAAVIEGLLGVPAEVGGPGHGVPGRGAVSVEVGVPGRGGVSVEVDGPGRVGGAGVGPFAGADVAAEVRVHSGPMVTTPWSKTVCFDGLGSGEVLVGDRKLVGISQRRTRHAARLQCCWYTAYDPAALPTLLAPDVRPPVNALRPVATLPAEVAHAIVGLLRDRL